MRRGVWGFLEMFFHLCEEGLCGGIICLWIKILFTLF